MGCIGPSIVVLQFGSLYKFVKIQGFHHCIILHVPGRDFQSQFQMDKPSANVLHQHTRSRAPPHMGELHLSVPLGDKRNQMKVGSFSRHSTVQPLKKNNNKKARKKDVWEGSKPRTLVVSENTFTCLYMSRYILFDMCIAFHLSTPLFSPFFFPIFTSKKVY